MSIILVDVRVRAGACPTARAALCRRRSIFQNPHGRFAVAVSVGLGSCLKNLGSVFPANYVLSADALDHLHLHNRSQVHVETSRGGRFPLPPDGMERQ